MKMFYNIPVLFSYDPMHFSKLFHQPLQGTYIKCDQAFPYVWCSQSVRLKELFTPSLGAPSPLNVLTGSTYSSSQPIQPHCFSIVHQRGLAFSSSLGNHESTTRLPNFHWKSRAVGVHRARTKNRTRDERM